MGFRDFIPEDEMEGQPFGDGGFQDFVPAKKPVKREVVKVVEKKPVAKPIRPKYVAPVKKGKKK